MTTDTPSEDRHDARRALALLARLSLPRRATLVAELNREGPAPPAVRKAVQRARTEYARILIAHGFDLPSSVAVRYGTMPKPRRGRSKRKSRK